MKGLLRKDYALLLKRKHSLVIFLLVAVMMATIQDAAFVIPYLTVLIGVWTVGSLSYDESNHGLAYLMTLPSGRRTYVIGKYLLCLSAMAAGWIFAVIIAYAAAVIRHLAVPTFDELLVLLVLLPPLTLIIDLMLPVQLKFGMEKSRIALIVIVCVIACTVFGVGSLFDSAAAASSVESVLAALPTGVIVLAAFLIAAACSVISALISIAIIEKKEF